MPEPRIVTTAVVISLIAGIVIIVGSLYTAIPEIEMILGIVSGIGILIAAIMLKIRPGEGTRGLRVCCLMWGSMIFIFSILGFNVGVLTGSLSICSGAILGIAGAAFVLFTKVQD